MDTERKGRRGKNSEKTAPKSIGKAETQILRYVLEKEPITVGEVAKHFQEEQGLARTTILTVMERLRKKGFLTRKESAGVYAYSGKNSQDTWLRQQISEFVETTLGGVVSPLVAYLVNAKITPAEIADLEKIVEGLSNDKLSAEKKKGGSK